MWAGRPDGGGSDRSTGGTEPFRDFVKMVASIPVGASATSQTETRGVGRFVAAPTGGSAGTEAHPTTQNRDYQYGDLAAAPASEGTGCGLVGVTGPRS